MPLSPRFGNAAPNISQAWDRPSLTLLCILLAPFTSTLHTSANGYPVSFAGVNLASNNQLPFPSPATPKLAANFQVTVSGQSLRELIQSLQTATHLPILLDRRIDPSSLAIADTSSADTSSLPLDPQAEPVMRPKILGPTLHQALDGLVAARETPRGKRAPAANPKPMQRMEWASAGELVLIGPTGQTAAAATEILLARTRLQSHLGRYPAKAFSWPELTTPAEALALVADTWNLDVSNVELPHDLWPAADLGKIHVTTALGAIASQFGQHFELEQGSAVVQARPLRDKPVIRLQYPLLELPNAQRESISRTGAKLLKREDSWELAGDAAAHFQIELAIFKRGQTGRASARAVTKYTFKFIGTVDDALTNLCQAGNLQLQTNQLTDQQKRLRIELEVKDQSIEDILREVAKQANLSISFAGDLATVTPAN